MYRLVAQTSLNVASKRRSPIVRTLILFMLFIGTAQARETIVFSCAITENSNAFAAGVALYTPAFDELGYDFEMESMPGKRSISNVKNGIVDGECGRIQDLGTLDAITGMVRVDVEVLRLRNFLWTNSPALAALSIADIYASDYRIAYVRGYLAGANELRKRESSESLSVNSIEQGMRMLAAKRVEYLVAPKAAALQAVQELNLQEPIVIAAPLGYYSIYPYLNDRHADLAVPLAQALKRQLADPAHPIHQFND